ncbi:MAG: GNAT family N-acetyltransferase [Bacteroidetes bacterium]|nr:GNAT family N-acetyltransferase [Bacteroidota bacterium]
MMDMHAHITPATADDSAAIALVHTASWREAYRGLIDADVLASLNVDARTAQWQRTFEHGRTTVLVVKEADVIVGFVSFGPSRDADAQPGTCEVYALYLLPSVWSRGYGAMLWDAVVRHERESGRTHLSVWVLIGNERATAFYERMGCRTDGATKEESAFGTILHEKRYLLSV